LKFSIVPSPQSTVNPLVAVTAQYPLPGNIAYNPANLLSPSTIAGKVNQSAGLT